MKVVDLPSTQENGSNTIIFGEVIGIHIDDAVLVDGIVDIRRVDPIARLGYRDYARITETFSMDRPSWPL